jgi:hypothetical protein
MVDILTASDFPEIRATLDVSLDITNLPDAVIALDIYLGRATEWVMSRNPAAETYTGAVDATSRAIRRACVLATAALIAPSLPWLTQETYENQIGYKRVAVDLNSLVADLWSQASAQMDLSLPTDDAPVYGGKPFFTTAKGRRGQ